MKGLIGLAIGISGGFVGGLIGLGGGVVMIPLMTMVLKLTQIKAHGTSLVAVVFTALAGAITYYFHGSANWKVAALIAATAMITARFGALYANSLPEKKLKRAFGVMLICVALILFVKGFLPGSASQQGLVVYVLIFLGTGVVTGFLSGMMGGGGGVIMIPPMVLLGGMPQQLAQGTSLLAMIPVCLIGSLTHYRLGNVQLNVAAGIAVGAIAGGYMGGTVANIIPELHLKIIFSFVLIWLGQRYVRTK
ncbi:MAG TPA: sulfite exporter TauE/SafE family protein [Syntrophorhabdaceae bacterium]|nr:sulfite exporter TauE/SafE family protein [Syntrophorhabdaceae bacterium]HQM81524.1 sulfite exporter TauE/SafE family protein [Syntrophorhabdaceae bacterium]